MATQPATTVADVLDKAADRLAPRGAWAQGIYGIYRDGPCCVIGAVGREIQARSIGAAELWWDQNVAPLISRSSDDIEEWNDKPTRRKSQVIAKLREAAAKARAEKVA